MPVLAFGFQVDGKLAAKIAADNPKLSPLAIKKAFQYLAAHEDVFNNQEYLSIANFDQPSTEERLYVINLRTGDTNRYLVTHGKNTSDPNDRAVAKNFSNVMDSKKSSVGFYRTLYANESVTITNSSGETYKSSGIYSGKHGRSLRLKGLQSTNSNALNREIVIHGAEYATPDFIKENKRLGESWGCPAVGFKHRDAIIDRIEGHSLYYIYKSGETATSVEKKTEEKAKASAAPVTKIQKPAPASQTPRQSSRQASPKKTPSNPPAQAVQQQPTPKKFSFFGFGKAKAKSGDASSVKKTLMRK